MIVPDGESSDVPHLHTLDASRSSAMASMVKPEVKLKAILEITRNLSTELKIDTVAPADPRLADGALPPGRAALPDPGRPRDQAAGPQGVHAAGPAGGPTSRATIPADEAQMSISRSIVNHVLVQKKAVLSQDASMDKNLPTSASIADLKIRSVMCVPLLTPDGQALGILQLDTSDRKQFHQEDLDVLTAVASQAAIAIQNATLHESLLERERLDRDLKLAEQVQKRFLPQSVPEIPGFEFFAHYDPAYEVGGDYYDFVPLPGNRCAVAVGDVSGKGVAAALMMAKFSGDTRYCILTENSPGAAANELNHLLFAAGIDEKFITLSLSVLDVERRTLTLSSAGHPADPDPPGQRQGRGGRRGNHRLPAGNHSRDRSTSSARSRLHPGDVVVVYSDGVTDARNLREELYDTRENPPPAPPAGRDLRRPGDRRPRHPPGHPRVLRGTRPGRRHHPDLLRPDRPGRRSSRDSAEVRGPDPRTVPPDATAPPCRSRSPISASSSTIRRTSFPPAPPAGSAWPRRRSSAGGSSARAWTPGATTTSTSSTRWKSSSPEDEARRGSSPTGPPTSSRSSPSGSTGPSPARGRSSTGR